MAKFFEVSSGLRGAYLTDNAAIIECETIEDLRKYVKYECDSWRDADYVGGAKRTVAIVTRDAWNHLTSLPYCIPLAPRYSRDSSGNYNYSSGIFIRQSTSLEFAEYAAESEDWIAIAI